MADIKHGTLTGYKKSGCRCEACTKANRDSSNESYRRRADNFKKGGVVKHGVTSSYQLGCRCKYCAKAFAEYQKKHISKSIKNFRDTGEFATSKTRHGSSTAYIKYRCRCHICKSANKKEHSKQTRGNQ